MESNTTDSQKILQIQNSKGFSLWISYITKIMRREGFLRIPTKATHEPETELNKQFTTGKRLNRSNEIT